MKKVLKQDSKVICEPPVSLKEVKQLLELGKILFSVLTPEEVEELKKMVYSEPLKVEALLFEKIGNTGVS
jgi:hypothetical protein